MRRPRRPRPDAGTIAALAELRVERWRAEPSLGAILRARVVPEVGGDTLFANMEAAYAGLDDGAKERIDGLQAVHGDEGFLTGMKAQARERRGGGGHAPEVPPAVHPVMRTHPVSSRKSLYVNRAFMRRIVDMEPSESDALLRAESLDAGASQALVPLASPFEAILQLERWPSGRRQRS